MSVSILTKSDLVLRDLDILKDLPDIEVGFSITTTDDDIATLLEPGASPPSRRFHALSVLAGSGIRTWVFISPLIPGIADNEEVLSAILREASRAGALYVDYDPLNCYPSAVAGLRDLFSRRFPDLLPGLEEACSHPLQYEARLDTLARKVWLEYGFTPPRRCFA